MTVGNPTRFNTEVEVSNQKGMSTGRHRTYLNEITVDLNSKDNWKGDGKCRVCAGTGKAPIKVKYAASPSKSLSASPYKSPTKR